MPSQNPRETHTVAFTGLEALNQQRARERVHGPSAKCLAVSKYAFPVWRPRTYNQENIITIDSSRQAGGAAAATAADAERTERSESFAGTFCALIARLNAGRKPSHPHAIRHAAAASRIRRIERPFALRSSPSASDCGASKLSPRFTIVSSAAFVVRARTDEVCCVLQTRCRNSLRTQTSEYAGDHNAHFETGMRPTCIKINYCDSVFARALTHMLTGYPLRMRMCCRIVCAVRINAHART